MTDRPEARSAAQGRRELVLPAWDVTSWGTGMVLKLYGVDETVDVYLDNNQAREIAARLERESVTT